MPIRAIRNVFKILCYSTVRKTVRKYNDRGVYIVNYKCTRSDYNYPETTTTPPNPTTTYITTLPTVITWLPTTVQFFVYFSARLVAINVWHS